MRPMDNEKSNTVNQEEIRNANGGMQRETDSDWPVSFGKRQGYCYIVNTSHLLRKKRTSSFNGVCLKTLKAPYEFTDNSMTQNFEQIQFKMA